MTKLKFLSISTMVVSVVALGAFFLFSGPAKQTSVLILVEAVQPTIVGQTGSQFDADQFELYKRTQSSLVKRRRVISDALRSVSSTILNSQSDPIAYVRARLEVDFLDDGQLMRIRMIGKQHEMKELSQILDSVMDSFLNMTRLAESTQHRRMIEFLQQERDARERRVEMLERQLKKAQEASDDAVSPAKLRVRENEIRVEAEILNDISKRLIHMKANLAAPSRVAVLQTATIEDVH